MWTRVLLEDRAVDWRLGSGRLWWTLDRIYLCVKDDIETEMQSRD
jgi:hypothetical protein